MKATLHDCYICVEGLGSLVGSSVSVSSCGLRLVDSLHFLVASLTPLAFCLKKKKEEEEMRILKSSPPKPYYSQMNTPVTQGSQSQKCN